MPASTGCYPLCLRLSQGAMLPVFRALGSLKPKNLRLFQTPLSFTVLAKTCDGSCLLRSLRRNARWVTVGDKRRLVSRDSWPKACTARIWRSSRHWTVIPRTCNRRRV